MRTGTVTVLFEGEASCVTVTVTGVGRAEEPWLMTGTTVSEVVHDEEVEPEAELREPAGRAEVPGARVTVMTVTRAWVTVDWVTIDEGWATVTMTVPCAVAVVVQVVVSSMSALKLLSASPTDSRRDGYRCCNTYKRGRAAADVSQAAPVRAATAA